MTLPVRLPPDGDNAWGGEARTVFAAVNGLGTGRISLLSYDSLKVAVSGGFDWAAAMTQAVADANTRGVRYIEIPNLGVDYKFSTAWPTLPTGIEIVGLGRPVLDFFTAGNITAITLGNDCRLRNVYIKGAGIASTAIAVSFNGHYIKVYDTWVENFGTGLYFVNSNTYIDTVHGSHIRACGVAVDARTASVTNSGEKFVLQDTVLADSTSLVKAGSSTLDMYFDNCSLDYSASFGTFDNGQYHFTNCHFETNNTTTTQGYLLQKINGASMNFTDCRFGMTGIPLVIDSATEGTSGTATYRGCFANFTPSAGGASIVVRSEHQFFLASGATTGTFDSPFISRTVLAAVSIGFHSNNPARAITGPTVTSSGAGSTLITVTYGAALAANTVAIVRFG